MKLLKNLGRELAVSGLKEIVYSGSRMSREGRVAYVVDDANIFFSGLTRGGSKSTINGAEDVIKAICEAEGLNWQDYQFFDIQTHRGYSSKSSGEYCMGRLVVVGDPDTPHVDAWMPESIPPEVLSLFAHLIW